MLTVHHLENSRSQRILWLLEELGVEYRIQKYRRDKKTSLAPPELKKVHPLGKAPVIEDNGTVVAETGAMIDYILDRYGEGRLRPQVGTPSYERYRYWLHYAEGSAMPPLLLKLVLIRMASAPMPFFAKPVAKRIVQTALDRFVEPTLETHFGFVESALGGSSWLAGTDFSAADIIMSFPLEAYAARSDLSDKPNIADFLDRVRARPAYQSALARGGPYAILQ